MNGIRFPSLEIPIQIISHLPLPLQASFLIQSYEYMKLLEAFQ